MKIKYKTIKHILGMFEWLLAAVAILLAIYVIIGCGIWIYCMDNEDPEIFSHIPNWLIWRF